MLSILFPFYLLGVCVTPSGMITPVQTFGPYQTYQQAVKASTVLLYGALCETDRPVRKFRYTTTAFDIDIDGLLEEMKKERKKE